MQVLYINNDGAGFADYIPVESGTSIETFFGQKVNVGRPADYLIRANRQPVTPTKIEGA